MEDTNETLAVRAQTGNEEAAAELIERFYHVIFAYLRRQTHNDEDAADLTQKVFTQAWNSLPKFKRQSQFSTWIHRIAYHTYVDWVRGQVRQTKRETKWWMQHAETSFSPFLNLEEKETANHIYEIVEQIDETLRRPIHLHYYQQLTLNQTAEILNVSVSTVKNRLRSAITLIKERAEPARSH